MCKMLSKYIATFSYVDKTLFVLLVTSGGFSIAFWVIIIDAQAGITNVRLD